MKSFTQFIKEWMDTRTDTSPKEIVQQAVDEIRSLGSKSPFDNGTLINNNVLVILMVIYI